MRVRTTGRKEEMPFVVFGISFSKIPAVVIFEDHFLKLSGHSVAYYIQPNYELKSPKSFVA